MGFSAIQFADGTEYTAQEVSWVVEDFQAAAERAVCQRRNSARYQMELRGTLKNDKTTAVVEQTDKDKFLAKVKACNDYNWILQVVQTRNEFDPMYVLRVQMLKSNRSGGSTMDIMIKHIDDVMRDTKSTYADRARIKDYMKFIEDMGKKWDPKSSAAPVVNVGVGVQMSPKEVNAGPNGKPIITINELRKENQ